MKSRRESPSLLILLGESDIIPSDIYQDAFVPTTKHPIREQTISLSFLLQQPRDKMMKTFLISSTKFARKTTQNLCTNI